MNGSEATFAGRRSSRPWTRSLRACSWSSSAFRWLGPSRSSSSSAGSSRTSAGLVTTILLLIVTLASQGTTAAVVLLILISILNLIQGKFLAPVIYHRTVDIHPAIALIALPAGAALAGIVGLFVAIPIVAFVMAVTSSTISILGVEPDRRTSESSPMVPVWLDRLGQVSWRLLVATALFALAILAAVQVPIVVVPVVLGIVLAATLTPLSNALQRRGWSRGRAGLAAVLGGTLGVIVIIGLTVASLIGPVEDMIGQASAGASSVDSSAGGTPARWSVSSTRSASVPWPPW